MEGVNWNDVYKRKELGQAKVTCSIPERYKQFMKENSLHPGKLLMRACEQLNPSLRDE